MTSRLQARLLAQRSLFQRLNQHKKRSKLQAGFTLIELLIVVVIIGILSAIAIPSFVQQRERAVEAAGKAEASSLARKCSAAVLTQEADDLPTAAEITAAANVTNGSCALTGGAFTGGGVTYTIAADGAITQS